MRSSKYAVILFVIFGLAGCCCTGFKQIKTSDGTLAVPTCCPMIKYSGTSITVKDIGLAIPHSPVNIGGVTVEPKVIQEACDIVQILEQHRISTCQILPSYATISKSKFSEALDAMQNDETALTQFALVVAAKNGEALQQFVSFYGPQARQLKAGAKTGEVKALSVETSAEPKATKSITVLPLRELLKK